MLYVKCKKLTNVNL